jgi:hypothetical protein
VDLQGGSKRKAQEADLIRKYMIHSASFFKKLALLTTLTPKAYINRIEDAISL